MSVTMFVDLAGVDRLVDSLGDQIDEAARPAAQAGAQVLYDEVKRGVARIGKKTGNLDRAIYQVFSRKNSGQGRATYHVSWNAMKAPHGHLVEYGHIQRFRVFMGKDGKWVTDKAHPLPQPRQVAAQPFLRPAIAKFDAALAAAESVILKKLGML